MNNKIMFTDKKISIIGLVISNIPLIDFLIENGAFVTARDKNTDLDFNKVKNINHSNLKFVLGKDYLENLNDEDIIVRSPGIRPDIPKFIDASKHNVKITSEIEIFMDLCPCKIIGITGSDGKTTTTTIISKLLSEEYGENKVYLGGNIGKSLINDLKNIKVNDFVVLELSSFQLMTLKKSPDISVITNITPNHLNWHIDFEEYINSKKNIYRYQDNNSLLVYNNNIKFITEKIQSKFIKFNYENGLHYTDNIIYFKNQKILNSDDILIPGVHNIENYMAAIGAVKELVSLKTIKKIASTFNGVKHRCQFVKNIAGVDYYNSSIDSSPTRTMAAISNFSKPVILICGGSDKNIPFDNFGDYILQKSKFIIINGENSNKIFSSIQNSNLYVKYSYKVIITKNIDEAINKSFEISHEGDIVLLSPASASFDQFKNFEERGNYFIKKINQHYDEYRKNCK